MPPSEPTNQYPWVGAGGGVGGVGVGGGGGGVVCTGPPVTVKSFAGRWCSSGRSCLHCLRREKTTPSTRRGRQRVDARRQGAVDGRRGRDLTARQGARGVDSHPVRKGSTRRSVEKVGDPSSAWHPARPRRERRVASPWWTPGDVRERVVRVRGPRCTTRCRNHRPGWCWWLCSCRSARESVTRRCRRLEAGVERRHGGRRPVGHGTVRCGDGQRCRNDRHRSALGGDGVVAVRRARARRRIERTRHGARGRLRGRAGGLHRQRRRLVVDEPPIRGRHRGHCPVGRGGTRGRDGQWGLADRDRAGRAGPDRCNWLRSRRSRSTRRAIRPPGVELEAEVEQVGAVVSEEAVSPFTKPELSPPPPPPPPPPPFQLGVICRRCAAVVHGNVLDTVMINRRRRDREVSRRARVDGAYSGRIASRQRDATTELPLVNV